VGEPDQGQGHDQAVGLPVAGAEHDSRQGRGVGEVVQVRAGTGSGQVAADGDVRGEDRGRHEPPRLAEGAEGDQRAGQQNEALEAEPPAGRPGDNALG
jgi:hypothetical protein